MSQDEILKPGFSNKFKIAWKGKKAILSYSVDPSSGLKNLHVKSLNN